MTEIREAEEGAKRVRGVLERRGVEGVDKVVVEADETAPR